MKPLFGKDAALPARKTIVFLGDSITEDGTYIALIDAYFRLHAPETDLTLINLGVSSETASGLSEAEHGFHRPCVHDRLERALAETKPDWVVVCYGMNDGIYHPLSEARFAAYRGGMLRLLEQIRSAGAKAIVMTPPPFDPQSLDGAADRLLPAGEPDYSYLRPYEGYDEVLARYAEWVLTLGDPPVDNADGEEIAGHAPATPAIPANAAPSVTAAHSATSATSAIPATSATSETPAADAVVSIHEPMLAQIAEARKANPAYASGDGIHPFAPGHWIIAKALLRELFNVTLERTPDYLPKRSAESVDGTEEASAGSRYFSLIWQRHRLMSAAWKEHVGHTNPNGTAGALPLAEASERAAALEARIREHASDPALRLAWRVSDWPGGERTDFMLEGREGFVILPRKPAEGRPWIWRTEFFGAFAQADDALLERGWAIAYVRLSDMYGCPGAVARMHAFRRFVTARFGLSAKPALFGFSRGGLYAFHYAATYPGEVSALYLDAPVLDIRSWPGGKGAGARSPREREDCKAVYGLPEDDAAWAKASPLDRIAPVAEAGVPILVVVGDADAAVPFAENAAILAERYRALGGQLELIVKPGVGHHPHSLADPAPIVAFMEAHR
ncbi:GDSL-type esterase/lipase family protein [Paenibacillus glycinis]|uniref:Prolyl oligopeptidase family serine peptidase n=1 Tax=Paenibacillus glycinis TaxID=2697035 RepID=A0ABW9XRG8_9BACL|nr:GDSL-type esterase/lipase family protein [Paenibacillus glycinis]NBD25146.1 prolyl oligopeptidase family serine peptidase [Paenibacillus glycinis]